jgi:hypothetical protein
MPALPSPGQVLRVVMQMKSTDGDLDVVTRFFLAYTGTAPTVTDADTIAGDIEAAWAAHLAGNVSSVYTLYQVTVEDLSSTSGATGLWTGSTAGSRSGTALAAGAAFVLQKKISRRYRGGHPRGYLPFGVTTDLADQNTWSSSYPGAIATAWGAFTAALIGTVVNLTTLTHEVNVSYYEGFTNHTYPSGRVRAIPTLRATPIVDIISGYQGNPQVGSQRRRNQQSV